MRAGLNLEGLAERFAVHLFVAPVAGDCGDPPESVRALTARIGVLPLKDCLDTHFALISRILDPEARLRAELAYPRPQLGRFCTPQAALRLREWFGATRFSAVHIMRLYLAPLMDTLLNWSNEPRPWSVLDLDDDEVRTRQRLARVAAENGDSAVAARETAEAEKYRGFQARYFPQFDRIMVCAGSDADRLSAEFPTTRFMIVPNGYRSPDITPALASADNGALRLIFVATLGYYANADAAIYLCREVLPALRRITGRRIQIDLVGSGAPDSVRTLGLEAELRIHDFVEDLRPLYAAADVAVVPLRAGGGTRIKILEAFAYGVPVVSTTLGAEGIEAVADQHLLLADTAEGFAQACLKIKEQSAFAQKLVCGAAALLAAKYSPAKIQEQVAAAYG